MSASGKRTSAGAVALVLATLLVVEARAQSAFGGAQLAPPEAEAAARAATDLFLRAETEYERAMAERSLSLVEQAQQRHREAAAALADAVRRYGRYDAQFELRLMYAHALSTAGQDADAARAYVVVRDAAPQFSRRRVAARRVVESWQAWIQAREREGVLRPRVDAPNAVGEPPQVPRLEMPEPLANLLDAWLHVRPGDPADADATLAYLTAQYEAAALSYRYGRWDEARPILERVFHETCQTAIVGRLAYVALRHMAIASGDSDETERLAREFQSAACTFGEPPDLYVNMPPHCFDRREFRPLQARTREVEAMPDRHLQAPLYLALSDEWLAFEGLCADPVARGRVQIGAAGLLARGGQARAAAELFEAAEHQASAARSLEESPGADVSELTSIEAEAIFRRVLALADAYDYAAATRAARELIDDPRFGTESDSNAHEWRLDLMGQTAWLHFAMGALREADALQQRLQRELEERRRRRVQEPPRHYGGLVPGSGDRPLRRHAILFAARVTEARGQTSRAIGYYRRYLTQFPDHPDTMTRISARWSLFELSDRSRRRPTRAALDALLYDVLAEVSRSTAASDVGPADFAARARMRLVDGHVERLEAYVRAHPRMSEVTLARGLALADAVTAAYAEALAVSSSRWGAVGISHSADAYALLLRMLDNTIGRREPREWQRVARSSLRCHVIVLDRLALGHGQQDPLGLLAHEASITRLAFANHSDVTRCSASPPAAPQVFPAAAFDPQRAAPWGMAVLPIQAPPTPELVSPP